MGLLEDLKNIEPIVYKVDNDGSLKWLERLNNTCKQVGNIPDNNSNVDFATYRPESWLPELIPYIIDNVNYITTLPTFEIWSVVNGKVYSSARRVSDGETFNTMQEVKDFLESKKYKMMTLYYITNQVDLNTLKRSYLIRYAEWEMDIQLARKGKLKEIMD